MFAAFPPALALRVDLRADEPQHLPPFLGSALHGVLGRALYRMVCVFARREACPGCPLLTRCTYPALFETPAGADDSLRDAGVRDQAPRPLVLAPEAGWTRADGRPVAIETGAEVPFRITLIGKAIAELPLVVVALQRAAQLGIGVRAERDSSEQVGHARLVLASVTAGAHVVYDAATDAYAAPPADAGAAHDDAGADSAVIELLSPLRLKVEGRVTGEITPQAFLAALARRANALSILFGEGSTCVDEAEVASLAHGIKAVSTDLKLITVRRYSSRQRRGMQWPGVMGRMVWRGDTLPALRPLLRFGEAVQVGKGTALGFGRYQMVTL